MGERLSVLGLSIRHGRSEDSDDQHATALCTRCAPMSDRPGGGDQTEPQRSPSPTDGHPIDAYHRRARCRTGRRPRA